MARTEHLPPSFQHKIPDGDDRERLVCTHCQFIDYRNPRVIVGCVATDVQDRILLCKRAIEPQSGFWTLPAGYLEQGESAEEGARREAREEAEAVLSIDRLLAIYSIVRISQVQLIYRARLENPKTIRPGPESQDVALVPFDDIPWTDLAFPSVVWALRHWQETKDEAAFALCSNPIDGI